MQKVENIAQNLPNFTQESKTEQKGKTILSKNKSNTERFRTVLEQVAKLAAERTKND